MIHTNTCKSKKYKKKGQSIGIKKNLCIFAKELKL